MIRVIKALRSVRLRRRGERYVGVWLAPRGKSLVSFDQIRKPQHILLEAVLCLSYRVTTTIALITSGSVHNHMQIIDRFHYFVSLSQKILLC